MPHDPSDRSGRTLDSRLFPALVAAVAMALPTPAAPQNHHPHGDFNDDGWIPEWTLVWGFPVHASEDVASCPASGSLRIDGESPLPNAPEELSALGPCLDWSEGGEAYVRFWYQGFALPAPNFVVIEARAFSGAVCAGIPVDEDGVGFLAEQVPWALFSGSVTVPAGGSLRLYAGAAGEDGCGVSLDELYVTRRPVVLLDDFEGGAVCRWTAEVGRL